MRGRVVRARDGWYFIQDQDSPGCEYFIDRKDVLNGDTLVTGQSVQFDVEFDRIRGTFATNVRPA